MCDNNGKDTIFGAYPHPFVKTNFPAQSHEKIEITPGFYNKVGAISYFLYLCAKMHGCYVVVSATGKVLQIRFIPSEKCFDLIFFRQKSVFMWTGRTCHYVEEKDRGYSGARDDGSGV